MAAVSTFNVREVRPWQDTQSQNSKVVYFPHTYVAPPRLSVGINELDLIPGGALRITTYTSQIDNRRYTAHIDTYADTTLYSAGMNVLVLKPSNLDILSGEFSTEDDHEWRNHQPRTSRRIIFSQVFHTPPRVLVYLKRIDAGGSSARVRTYATDIDVNGFTIHLDSWDDTKLYVGVASWIAYPEDKDYISSGTAAMVDRRLLPHPQAESSGVVNFKFGGAPFFRNPDVFIALNSIDISLSKNARIRVHATDVTPGGLTWHMDTWSDTVLYSSGITYIALN